MFLDRHIAAEDGLNGILTAAPGGSCASCIARVHSICAEFDKRTLALLEPRGRRRHLAKGQVFLWQDDRTDVLANVLGGIVGLVSLTPEGTEQIVGLVGAGGFVGNGSGEGAPFSVVALTDVELCSFPSTALQNAAADGADPQRVLLRRVARELERARHWMVKLGRASAIERVAALLLEFQAACPDATMVPFALSRGQMGDFAGLSIETVSRQLTRLRAEGIIEIDRRSHFRILDLHQLRELAQLPVRHRSALH